MSKVCTKCHKELPLTDFHRHPKNGHKSRCRACCALYQQDRLTWLVHKQVDSKCCQRCHQTRDRNDFGKDKYATDGLQVNCRQCLKAIYQERKAKLQAKAVSVSKVCGKCGEEKVAEAFHKSPNDSSGLKSYCIECGKVHQRARLYGITEDEFRRLIRDGCFICGSHDRLHVDHDHACCDSQRSCGKCVRGALCARHNQALGIFKDDPKLLLRAIRYLEAGGQTGWRNEPLSPSPLAQR